MAVLKRVARALRPRDDHPRAPGSAGERELQARLGTAERAEQFYRNQLARELTPVMKEFIGRMEMAFIATSDADGECDCSFRAGPAGFIRVLDDTTVAYPEYRGNGVMASLGNMLVNPHIGIFLVDFTRDLIGLHVNGEASIVPDARMRELDLDLGQPGGRRPAPGAVGAGQCHRGLHSLLQAHPAARAPVPGPALGHRQPAAQGRRLLRRPGGRGAGGARRCAAGRSRRPGPDPRLSAPRPAVAYPAAARAAAAGRPAGWRPVVA